MNRLDIIATLQKALNLSDSAKISSHPAGAVNHVYRVQELADSQLALIANNLQSSGQLKSAHNPVDLAVKWMGDDDFSGVNRAHQFALQQQLYRLGVAPQPIWLSDDETIWVEQWLEHSDSATLSMLELANTLARIHSLPITARPLDLASRWQHYINVAQLDMSSELYLKAQSLRKQVIKSEQDDDDYVLCHNDLLTNHLLLSADNSLKIIDWEYAAMGNRYFDLASCCLINKLEINESRELVKHYAKLMNIDEHDAIAKFDLHTEIVAITNDLWFAALNANKV
ncbi:MULTISPECIES: phosphotransferase [unclassified Alteromonas]|uniref:phosphotransferase n=1 Tax=unclassified Alteromonas TaxID=2614992 RepID=UPI001EF2A653|nr:MULTISPECIES: phosphotransferase [Alteromonas]MCG7648043.1 phosphotransferase [Alteromonas sp. MmMcT2-5]